MKDRLFWFLFVVATLVLAIVLGIWRYFRPLYRYKTTNDNLFNHFSFYLLWEMEINSRTNSLYRRLFKASALDEYGTKEQLATRLIRWEDMFKDDAHYWQLRVLYGVQALPFLPSTDPQAEQHLLKLFHDGCPDEACFGAFNYFQLSRDEPQTAIDLARCARLVAPDNAFYHYMLAALLADQGETEQAVEALRIGNAAPRNELPPAYPFAFLAEYPEYLKHKAVQAVAGHLLGLRLNWINASGSLMSKGLVKHVIQSVDLNLQPGIADDLLTYSLRYAKRESFGVVRILFTLALVGIILDQMQKRGPKLTPEQLCELDQIREAISQLKEKASQHVKNQALPNDRMSEYQASINVWKQEQADRVIANECLEILSILDPPPFAAWARGELVFADE